MYKIKKIVINKNIIILTSVVLLVGSGVFLYLKQSDYFVKQTDGSSSPDTLNLEPPTDQDKKEAENHKEQLSTPPTNPSASGKVTPIITSWGQSNGKVEVATRVPGILEEGGVCTLTLKRNNETRTGSSNGIANVSEVSCGFIAIVRTSLTAGEWSATVTYSSSKASGTSEAKNIMVE